jgi:hypothetical protein
MKFAKVAVLAAMFALCGCQSLESALTWATSAPATSTEVNTVAAAANLYTAAVKAADAFVKTPACPQAARDKIAALSHAVRLDLDDALAAEQAGDSAKMTVALDAFNQAYPAFLSYLQTNGVNP